MNFVRFGLVFGAAALTCAAADRSGPPRGEAADKTVRLQATAWLDKASIRQAVGEELPAGIVVIEVKLTPAAGRLPIVRDDFLLRSDRDGQRATPYEPSQIAGDAVLRVTTTYDGGGVVQEDRGPAWGGLGGGRPSRLPGSNSPGIGNTASAESADSAIEANPSARPKANPLLAALKQKILPEKEIEGETTGLLYFLLEGKQKPKDIELLYKTPAGRLSVRFK
jgi:hypothetical protein